MPITVEWTEACRSGSCETCQETQDEVLWVSLTVMKSVRLCPKCAAQLAMAIIDRVGGALPKCL